LIDIASPVLAYGPASSTRPRREKRKGGTFGHGTHYYSQMSNAADVSDGASECADDDEDEGPPVHDATTAEDADGAIDGVPRHDDDRGLGHREEGGRPLSPRQVESYLRDGILVVDLLSRDEVREARRGLASTLLDEYGVDVNDLAGTGRYLANASSTNGAGTFSRRGRSAVEGMALGWNAHRTRRHISHARAQRVALFLSHPFVRPERAGGVLDIFYPEWKMKIASNERLFRMTCQLWKEAYCHSDDRPEDMTKGRSADGKVSSASSSHQMTNGIDELECRTCGGVDDGACIANEGECTSFKWHPFGPFDCDRGYMVR
jgi:hypothetical protein